MANEVEINSKYGYNIYGLLYNSARQIYDVGDTAMENVGTWANARLDECDIPLTEFVAGWYRCDMPSGLPADTYAWAFFLRNGETVDIDNDFHLDTKTFIWDGSQEVLVNDQHVSMLANDTSDAAQLAILVAGMQGDGSITVSHDYHNGTTQYDMVIYMSGNPVDEVMLRAYLKANYEAENYGAEYVEATTKTNTLGEWVASMRLDPGTYLIEASLPGTIETATMEVVVI